ncbi:hypothetical protein ES703_36807 [subsurface metagenome]
MSTTQIEGTSDAYRMAQEAIALLKTSIYLLIESSGNKGISNAQIGKSLGIYQGHVGHEGHIPRTLLALMEAEGVVHQDRETKKWFITDHTESE